VVARKTQKCANYFQNAQKRVAAQRLARRVTIAVRIPQTRQSHAAQSGVIKTDGGKNSSLIQSENRRWQRVARVEALMNQIQKWAAELGWATARTEKS